MERLFYFGTSIEQAGHYFFHLHGGSMDCTNHNFPTNNKRIGEWPFNPENFIDEHHKKGGRKRGCVFCGRIAGFTIIAIEGSCSDTRGGSKSIFFTDMEYLYKDLATEMVQLPIVKAILKQCKFKINWPFYESINEEIKKYLI